MIYFISLFSILIPFLPAIIEPPAQKVVTSELIYKNNYSITKQQLAKIMATEESKISDKLMKDFTRAVELFDFDKTNIAYFLGQVGHESAGLKHKVEIHDGSRYEWRRDLGNIYRGDGVVFAGGGYLQLTGRYNYTNFYKYLKTQGIDDPKVLSHGKHHVAEHYPWTSGAWWWFANDMISYCKKRPTVQQVSAKVNGKYWPNGLRDRQLYSHRAFSVLNLPYPG
jgi:predicted chitinase